MFFRLPIVKFFSRLLNRATITVALVLLQAGWLLWAFSYLTTGRIWVNAALRLLSLFIVLYLVRKDEDSSYKIIWIVLIGLLPLLGGALYLVFGNKAPSKGMRRRMQSVEKAHTGDLAQQPGPCTRSCWPIWKKPRNSSFWNTSLSAPAKCGVAWKRF